MIRGLENLLEEIDEPGEWCLDTEDGIVYFCSPTFSLEDWKEQGYDAHFVIADPLFVDAKRDDYRLKSTSPAIKLGFVPMDASQTGIRKKTAK